MPSSTTTPAKPRTIVLSGRTLTYTVRRSPRARSLRLRVTPQIGLEVVAPQRGRLPDLEALLRAKTSWIVKALDRCAAIAAATTLPPRAGELTPYRGDAYRLLVEITPGRQPRITLDTTARVLTVTLPERDDARLAAVLEAWYRMQARARLSERATHFARVMGVDFGRLTVRDQRTRWGSCSSRGNLNFSWRLILAPDPVLDYVAIHELAHRREMNHGPSFWALVEAHCPNYRAHRAWLRQHQVGQ